MLEMHCMKACNAMQEPTPAVGTYDQAVQACRTMGRALCSLEQLQACQVIYYNPHTSHLLSRLRVTLARQQRFVLAGLCTRMDRHPVYSRCLCPSQLSRSSCTIAHHGIRTEALERVCRAWLGTEPSDIMPTHSRRGQASRVRFELSAVLSAHRH